MESLNFLANVKNLDAVLSSGNSYRYIIPNYQRPYTWDDDNISDFWNDLYSNNGNYFIGSLVLNSEHKSKKGYVEIIDGQQRMLTITIFFAVLRDIAQELDPELARRVHINCISFEDRRGNQTYRISCGDSTREFFEKNIQSGKPDFTNIVIKKLTEEEKKIYRNYLSLKEKVENELKKYENNKQKIMYLNDLWDKISGIKVICIEIENEDDAYEIFETVNDRGVDLSVADLLKNLIFKEIKPSSDKEKDELKAKWKKLTENVQESGFELSKFIRYYWLSKRGFITERSLFKEIKKKITKFDDFLDELIEDSESLRMLLDGDMNEWKDISKDGDKIFQSLLGIGVMNVSQCYVLLLAILRNIKKLETNPKRIFKLIENFTFSYSIICKLPTNRVEKIYSKFALKIEKKLEETDKPEEISKCMQTIFNDLEKELKDIKPSYQLFYENFLDISYRNNEQSRTLNKYILAMLNSKHENGEYELNFGNINIEHLLPQKPSSGWGLKRSDISKFVNKLGNLTLVHKKTNSRASNKIMSEKIEDLEESEIPMTQEVIEVIKNNDFEWGETDILERQQKMAKDAYELIWKY